MHRKIVLATGLGFFLAAPAHAYTNFIGFGYTSCITCHYNPFGNGALTDYGRALGATAIAAKPFFKPKITDDELGAMSGFLGSKPLPRWLRLQGNFRGLLAIRQLQSTPSYRFVPMRTDVTSILQFNDNKIFITGTLGYAPNPSSGSRGDGHLISREHYIGFRPSKKLGFYLGKSDVVYGIRIVDHDAYSRARTKLSYNDQTYGLFSHWAGEKFELGLHLIAGNIAQASNVRQKGFSSTFEYDIFEKGRLGASFLYTFGSFRKRTMGSFHLRMGAGEGNSILIEHGFINENIEGFSNLTGMYNIFQSMIRIMRGLHILMTLENYTENIFGSEVRYFRIGPSVQYFPFQRLEIRSDFQAERLWGRNTGVDPDTYRAMIQGSLWF